MRVVDGETERAMKELAEANFYYSEWLGDDPEGYEEAFENAELALQRIGPRVRRAIEFLNSAASPPPSPHGQEDV